MQRCFEKFKHAVGKIQKPIKPKLAKKIKYEISTDLPSVRARRFESDERDLSPASLAIGCPVLEK
jgi:hypothetical protein